MGDENRGRLGEGLRFEPALPDPPKTGGKVVAHQNAVCRLRHPAPWAVGDPSRSPLRLATTHRRDRPMRFVAAPRPGDLRSGDVRNDEVSALARDDMGARAVERLSRGMDGRHRLRSRDRRPVVADRPRPVAVDPATAVPNGTHRAVTKTRPLRPPPEPTTQRTTTTVVEENSQADQHRGRSAPERRSPGLGIGRWRDRGTTPRQPNRPDRVDASHERVPHEQSVRQDPPLAAPPQEAEDLVDPTTRAALRVRRRRVRPAIGGRYGVTRSGADGEWSVERP
jgi:hypothetical protein